MSDFKFEEEDNIHRANKNVKKKSVMAKWLQSKGIAKSEKTAQLILILVIVICFGISLMLLADTLGWFI